MKAVFFDIGETLINESRVWLLLADWIGVPPMTMFSILGQLISEGRSHLELFDMLRPDLGWRGVVEGFRETGRDRYLDVDLYPDVVDALRELKDEGYFVGIAGNQPAHIERDLRALNLPVDLIATSDGWGLSKPDPAFFQRVAQEAGVPAHEIAYVGDRVDYDVIPAAAAGMTAIHIIRGPWGYIQRDEPGASQARAQIKFLTELPGVLKTISS